MAKFIKAVNLWAADVQESILEGTLVLQRGQYVHCCQPHEEYKYPLSRYISHANGVFNIVHGGTGAEVLAKYKTRVKLAHIQEQRNTDRLQKAFLRGMVI